MKLPESCQPTLPGGDQGTRYWISVQAQGVYGVNGFLWFWENRNPVLGEHPYWQQPNNPETNCQTWRLESECNDGPAGDHMFKLKGKRNL